MRIAMLAALCAFAAACGAYQFPGAGPSPSPTTGTVSGRVLAVPCTPVEQAGSTCPGKPVQGREIDYVNGSTVIAKAVTDANGQYSIRLAPGTYDVKFTGFGRVISGPTKITVAAGSNVVADYLLDSGIRAPVAQQ